MTLANYVIFRKLFLFLLSLLIMGCATLSPTSTITVKDDGVTFSSSRPAKMSLKKGDTEYTYDSQAESFFSKLMGVLTLGAMAR